MRFLNDGQRVGPSSHNTNPPSVFASEVVTISDVADSRLEDALTAVREFIQHQGQLPTAAGWTEAGLRPSETTIRRRRGSFQMAIERACRPAAGQAQ